MIIIFDNINNRKEITKPINMEKKNTLLLTVIAVATLLVAVVGATFAYFASTIYNNAVLNVNGVAENSTQIFTTAGDASFNFNIAASEMSYDNRNETVAKYDNTQNITVSYVSGGETATSCTYDLMFTWENDSTIYTPTNTEVLEFTVSAKENNAVLLAERNFPAQKQGLKLNSNGSLSISSSSNSTSTNVYDITVKFYNINADQADLGSSHFKGHFYIDNINCGGQVVAD